MNLTPLELLQGFSGIRIIESVHLTEPGDPVEVRRTWRERLFDRPWRPWRATKTVVPQVPMKHALRVGDVLYMHPQTARAFKSAIDTTIT